MTKKRNGTPEPDRPDAPGRDQTGANMNLGGFLGKLGAVVDKLVDLAETGETLSHSGELSGLDPAGKLRGVFGISVRSALGGQGSREWKIEPFGNIRQQPSGETVFEEVREPLVDVHEEDDHVLVLAELPGISKKDVQVDLAEDRLTIQAGRGEKRYQKEVALPGVFRPEDMRWECVNGILKIRLAR